MRLSVGEFEAAVEAKLSSRQRRSTWSPSRNGEITRILKLPETLEKLGAMGMDVVASSPEQFTQTIKDDATKLDAVIKASGIKLD